MKRKLIFMGLVLILAATPVLANANSGTENTGAASNAPAANNLYLPMVSNNSSSGGPVVGAGCTTTGNTVLEGFENASGWVTTPVATTGSSITQSSAQIATGSHSALAATNGSGQYARLQVGYSEDASNHVWGERPGTYLWQQTCVYVPSSSVSSLGAGEYLTVAAFYPSAGGPYGWYLRIKQGGQMYLFGYTADGTPAEFNIYSKIPTDKWFELEIGLHSQAGAGVKRAFAVVVDGNFYGWYHQGNMGIEVYNTLAVGIVSTNHAGPLQVYVDQWRSLGNGAFPNGPDLRPTTNVQTMDFRTQSGVMWQIDWSTWANKVVLAPGFGMYSASSRVQAGRNQNRMPDLSSGWAEIEVDWPLGQPPAPPAVTPNPYFAAMVGFRKDIAREENLEIIPISAGNGNVDLGFEAWVNEGPLVMARWPIPAAADGSHIPQPGDVIRVRWEQISATQLHVQASYYRGGTWYRNVIDYTFDNTNVGANPALGIAGVNFTDGYHTKSELTIDSQFYSIRHYTVGTLSSYVAP